MPLVFLLGIALNQQTALGSIVILTLLILPVQECGISFHLCLWFLVSFISILQFLEYGCSASGRFISMYFFWCSGKWDCFLNFSDISLIVYRNARDFYILILYPSNLPNSLMSPSSFMVVPLEFSAYSITSTNSNSFTSFPVWKWKWSCSVVSYSLQPHGLYSPPGSSVHGIFQARILAWIAISFSRGSSWPRDQTQVSRIAGRCFTIWATREALIISFFFFSDYCDKNFQNCWIKVVREGIFVLFLILEAMLSAFHR